METDYNESVYIDGIFYTKHQLFNMMRQNEIAQKVIKKDDEKEEDYIFRELVEIFSGLDLLHKENITLNSSYEKFISNINDLNNTIRELNTALASINTRIDIVDERKIIYEEESEIIHSIFKTVKGFPVAFKKINKELSSLQEKKGFWRRLFR